MKKIVTLVIVLIAFLVTGCGESNNQLFDIEHEIYPSPNLEIVTEKDTYSKDTKEIKYYIKNVGEDESGINSDENCFELHFLKDGQWKRVGTKVEHYWTDVAIYFPAGHVEERKITLDEYYNLPLESGEYRIVVEQQVSNTFKIK